MSGSLKVCGSASGVFKTGIQALCVYAIGCKMCTCRATWVNMGPCLWKPPKSGLKPGQETVACGAVWSQVQLIIRDWRGLVGSSVFPEARPDTARPVVLCKPIRRSAITWAWLCFWDFHGLSFFRVFELARNENAWHLPVVLFH